ncbi:hypothetical protein IW261DRAFT_1601127 [Armillaria novae-zelandiae]|uniref:Uncharacterized protein n=1 Tax=Armillaria novae-zelandiae TaxID=153914 RepID=A0AA39TIA7_9AGAR|nr:hypothetical protein IW261DRAFT_1601127 [Armillaria novae-zelandiae]
MSTLNTTEGVADRQHHGELHVELPAPRSLLSISRQPQSLSTTSLMGHFTDMRLAGDPLAKRAPRSLLSISSQSQNISMSSVTGHFDDMRLLKETYIPPLQCESSAISCPEVQKEETLVQLVLRCARKDNNQCNWHFFYQPGTPWSVIAPIVSGHHHFCPMSPPTSQPRTSTVFSPAKTRSMLKARKSETQKKVRVARAGKKQSKGTSPENPIQVLPHLQPLSACPKFPEYDLANNDKMDKDIDPHDGKQKVAKYETLFRPHCGGPPYILDVDSTNDQFKTVQPSSGTDVAELKECPRLRPATW